MFSGKQILVCVTGGIAAYKAAQLVRELIKRNATVQVAMSKSACEFITPLTFQALSQQPVATDMFRTLDAGGVDHIQLSRAADVVVVAPATANTIGKMAHGIADDLISTTLMASNKPIVVAPAMNKIMWSNPIVQENLSAIAAKLKVSVVTPEEGELACREYGPGRLAEVESILDHIYYQAAYSEHQDLAGEKVVISAGPTFEDLDPVRYLANRSSGKMGYALAREARARGAQVSLITGPTNLSPPADMRVVQVRSARQMAEAVLRDSADADVCVMSAAVADYAPQRFNDQKIKKSSKKFTLHLEETLDILKELGRKKRKNQFIVGFAAESERLLENAKQKLKIKKADLVVCNDITRPDSGFESDDNTVRIVDTSGHVEELPLMPKWEVGRLLFDLIQQRRAKQRTQSSRPRHKGRSTGSGRRPPRSGRSAPKGTAAKSPNAPKKSGTGAAKKSNA